MTTRERQRVVAGRWPAVDTLRRMLYLVAVAAGVIASTALFVVIMGAVISRYFELPLGSWMQALPRVLFPWLVCAGFGVAGLTGQHIAMEALTQRVAASSRRLMAIASCVLMIVLYTFLSWQVVLVLQIVGGMQYPLLGISQGWGYGALLLGLGLLALGALLEGVSALLVPTVVPDTTVCVSRLTGKDCVP
ncbi:TRAP transporter small permease [Salinicola peritrichatus]|uniref:TRAP transporter small permease n=1 Tax=Salinicola peritrichatus TaxID=1267424 RepID=UPI000DA20414|nr:TRAP transporter small permease subunit [Salinicola peritrichatus]